MTATRFKPGWNRTAVKVSGAFLLTGLFVLFGLTYWTFYTPIASSPLQQHAPPPSPPLTHAPAPSTNVTDADADHSWTGRVKPMPWYNGTWDTARDSKNRLLSAAECSHAFPGLYADHERAIKMRRNEPITQDEMDRAQLPLGFLKGYIYDQQIYVLDNGPLYATRVEAILQGLHRAVITSPEPLPNIEFVYGTSDTMPNETAIWGVTHGDGNINVWLMPDFGFWSWPEPKVSSFEQQQRDAIMIEEGYPAEAPTSWHVDKTVYSWKKKDPRLAWRGAVMEFDVRQSLVNETKGRSWADVRELDWSDHDSLKRNRLTMAEHCKYKFLAQTEGFGSSGRLKHLHNCRSVVFSPKARWYEHFHAALRSSGPEQNYVEVKDDWSDLEAKVEELLKDDAKAERIADNNVKTFRERYLSLAAETCYWRNLIRSWREVSFEPNVWEIVDGRRKIKGVSVEDWLLMRTVDWEAH